MTAAIAIIVIFILIICTLPIVMSTSNKQSAQLPTLQIICALNSMSRKHDFV